MVRADFRQTRSKSGSLAPPAKASGLSLLGVSAFIWRALQTIMSAKVSPVEESLSILPEMLHLSHHKILLWAMWHCTVQPAAKLILTEWPVNGSRCVIPVRWQSSKEWAIMDAST